LDYTESFCGAEDLILYVGNMMSKKYLSLNFNIEAKPICAFHAIGTIKGKFLPVKTKMDTPRPGKPNPVINYGYTGTNDGTIITSYGNFPAFAHSKLLSLLNRVDPDKELYFLVWVRNGRNGIYKFTIVGIGDNGVDNLFYIGGIHASWNEEGKHTLRLQRNFNSKTPTKHEKKYSTRPFKVNMVGALPEEGHRKMLRTTCKILNGQLSIIEYEILNNVEFDPLILKSPRRKKLKFKNKDSYGCDKVAQSTPTSQHVIGKPLILRKKITVGLTNDDKEKTKEDHVKPVNKAIQRVPPNKVDVSKKKKGIRQPETP
jgi:hypothetical protein